MLVCLMLLPIIGGVLAWLLSRWNRAAAHWVALLAMLLQFALALGLWIHFRAAMRLSTHGPWLLECRYPWIPQAGISFHLALDGMSLLLLLLTSLLGVWSVLASWQRLQARMGFFYFNLLWALAGISGVLLAVDLFLFYFCWEVMLIPLFFLIDIWGNEKRHEAAMKFFIFTQAGGLFLLIGILGLYFINGRGSFDYSILLGTHMPLLTSGWLLLCFFLGFAVKLPVVPLHTWLPDAHTQAPVDGSVDLAGLVLKVAAYGMIRFMIPLFPAAATYFAPVAMTLAVIGIIYGALLAFAQTDLKRLVAYTSISHVGFVLLGIFAWNGLALQGVLLIVIASGISAGALFVLIGALHDRIGTRDLERMGGLWPRLPGHGGVWLFFTMATLGLPGLGGFIGEFLVLQGTFHVSPLFASLATIGFILSVVYALRMVLRIFFGPPSRQDSLPALSGREWAVMASAILLTLWLGLYPQPVLDTAAGAVRQTLLPAPSSYSCSYSNSNASSHRVLSRSKSRMKEQEKMMKEGRP